MGPWEVILLLLCMSSTCLGQAVEGSGSWDRTRLISGRGPSILANDGVPNHP
uniref:Uncharacterized protein n=1 Tax=Anguilla anguilla TaxID=7936 RepID=A0A0E9SKY1_ANGAN